MKIYIVIEPHKDKPPQIIGVYKTKAAAEKAAYIPGAAWRNVIETTFTYSIDAKTE